MALVEMDRIEKQYRVGDTLIRAVDGVTLTVESGEMVAVVGCSGSGKSTLMHLLGLLDNPSAGEYRFGGELVTKLSDRRLSALRNRQIGFVFQSFLLLPTLSALENVELPLQYQGISARLRRELAMEALEAVGLQDRICHRPAQLSGGQQQRVAIARAIAGKPTLLLADEPTGNLDTAAGRSVMQLIKQWNRAGNTVILITHDPRIAVACPRRLTMSVGRITEKADNTNFKTTPTRFFRQRYQ